MSSPVQDRRLHVCAAPSPVKAVYADGLATERGWWKPRRARVCEEQQRWVCLFKSLQSAEKRRGWRLLREEKKKRKNKTQSQLPLEIGSPPEWKCCGCCPEPTGGTSSWGSGKASLGSSHGLATSLLALPAGDLGRALDHLSIQELSSQTLPDSGRTLLPDVQAR